MNDSDLVQGLREKNPAAVRHLAECHLPSVWRFVSVRVDGDPHLAEDIVSEAVLALLRAVGTDTNIQNPGAWLRSVANHKVQDHYRAVARVRHLIEGAKQKATPDAQANPAQHQETQEKRAEIRRAMDELSDQQRTALEWKYLDKLSVREIAVRWETTEKAVESILFRGRRELRMKLLQTEVADDLPSSLRNGSRKSSASKPKANKPQHPQPADTTKVDQTYSSDDTV